jgi:hypothetical protein
MGAGFPMTSNSQPDTPPEGETDISTILDDACEWYFKEHSKKQINHTNLMKLGKKKYSHFKATGEWDCSLWELRICLIWFHRLLHWNGLNDSDEADILALHKRIIKLEGKITDEK